MKIIKVAIYARVSTSNGHQSPEMQLQALREYCEAREFKIYREYVDEGVSGAKDSRPALNELMDDARKRKFDTVLVWKFDRFARSTKHLISALEEFKYLGIDFISYSENINTTSPLGKAVFTIVAAIGELERSLIVERVKSGLEVARKKGKKLGRPGKAVNVNRFRKLLLEGMTVHAAARKLNIPIFAMVDTNTDPTLVDFAIPANDDASKSIHLIVNAAVEAIAEGLNERKLAKDKQDAEDAENQNDDLKTKSKAIQDAEDEEDSKQESKPKRKRKPVSKKSEE